MGKYLDEIDLFPSNLYGNENKLDFAEGTASILCALNKNFHRNIRSRFGKVVVKLWPEGTIEEKSGLIPPFELDTMSNVAVVNIEFDITRYIKVKNSSERDTIAIEILKNVFLSIPKELGLEGDSIIAILEKEPKGRNLKGHTL